MKPPTNDQSDASQQHAGHRPGAWKQDFFEACAGLLTCALLTFVLFAASAPSAPALIGGH